MHTNFRQGIISYPILGGQQDFLSVSGGQVSLSPKSQLNITFAYGTENYLFVEPKDVINAWSVPLPNTDYWLYWDLNRQTGVRTFGVTTVEPVTATVQPTGVNGLHWFNPLTQKMSVFKHYNWVEVVRVFAAKLNNTTFTPLGTGIVGFPYAGTQVGLTDTNVISGRIVLDSTGHSIVRRNGKLLTSDDNMFINSSYTNNIRLDTQILYGTASEHINQYSVVKLSAGGIISLAHYNDTHNSPTAVAIEQCLAKQTGLLCLRGTITNPQWEFSVVGAPLWISTSGQLTETNPFTVDPYTFPINKPPVANVISPNTVYFNSMMGGKGASGATSVTPDLATDAIFGLAKLSVAPTTDNNDPIWVGTNDPRLIPYIHPATHPATMITTSAYKFLTGANLQLQLEHLADRTLNSLSDVLIPIAAANMFLVYNGTNWIASYIPTVQYLNELLDVTLTTPSVDDSLTFNGTQWVNSPLHNITLTGDASGVGSSIISTTLATVNLNVGTFGDATNSLQITVNDKGLVTSATTVPFSVGVGGGNLTSVNTSGGTTGMFFTGGPITTTGTLTLDGTLNLASGGTGSTTANLSFNSIVPPQCPTPVAIIENTAWMWGTDINGSLGMGTPFIELLVPTQLGTLIDWVQISTGGSSAAIKTDGTLWTWGNNSNGWLGLGDTTHRSSPTQVGTLTDWAEISAAWHLGAIKTNGTLWMSGDNSFGQMGLGDELPRSSPTQVGSLTNWKHISCGYNISGAIKTDGTLWMWGRNNGGRLGLGDLINRSSPTQVGTLTNWETVSVSASHVAAVKTDGTLWTWGFNGGDLGVGDTLNRSSPTQVGSLTDWKHVYCLFGSTIAIKTNGTLWAWGENWDGQLGLGDLVTRSSPVQVGALTTWDKLGGGNQPYNFILATRTDGTLWTWGEDAYGQLGLGDLVSRSSPVQVGSSTNWTFVSTGTGAWGAGAIQQFIQPVECHTGEFLQSDGYDTHWQPITLLPNSTYMQPLMMWGSSPFNGIYDSLSTPTQYQNDDWSYVNLGFQAMGGIKLDGTLWMWGDNIYGQLGNGNTTFQHSPVQVGTDTNWKMISNFYYHTGAIKHDGSMWGWGTNANCELGDGTTTDRLLPTQIGTTSDWRAVSKSSFHGAAVKNDGTLWTWGDASYGRVGLGLGIGASAIKISVPTQVGALADWKQVEAGGHNGATIAVKTDGTLWAWGYNAGEGLLGLGDMINRDSPVQVGALTDWLRVSCGYYSAAAIKTDGTLWMWGANGYGQLGIGDITDRSSPVQVGALTDWVHVTCGYTSFGIKKDGSLWGWGDNSSGQLGTAYGQPYTFTSSPVQIGALTDWYSLPAGAPQSRIVGIRRLFGVLPIEGGGTGVTTTAGALQSFFPSYPGQGSADYVLTTDGTTVYWAPISSLP